MADHTKIEWTDSTWNPIAGCSVVSAGCTNCYAMKQAGGRLARTPKFCGLTQESNAGPVWNGEVRLWEPALDQPLRWPAPRHIFVNSMSDLFHESVPELWIDRIFAVMALCPQHIFQVLTKRAERMRDYLRRDYRWGQYVIDAAEKILAERQRADIRHLSWDLPTWPLQNVHVGVSVEDQARVDERIPPLLETPAAVRWISAEPLLGPVNIGRALLDWIVIGGESGPGARPMHPNWARSLRDQCIAAGVPFFFKQWGEWAPVPEAINFSEAERFFAAGRPFEHHSSGHTLVRVGKRASGRRLDGREWNEMPAAR